MDMFLSNDQSINPPNLLYSLNFFPIIKIIEIENMEGDKKKKR